MNKQNLKPFDLEAFKAGAKAVTRDGRPVRYLGEINAPRYPIVCAVSEGVDFESTYHYSVDGLFHVAEQNHGLDIFMLPNTTVMTRYLTVISNGKGGFIPGGLFETQSEAEQFSNYDIKPIKIEIEYEE